MSGTLGHPADRKSGSCRKWQHLPHVASTIVIPCFRTRVTHVRSKVRSSLSLARSPFTAGLKQSSADHLLAVTSRSAKRDHNHGSQCGYDDRRDEGSVPEGTSDLSMGQMLIVEIGGWHGLRLKNCQTKPTRWRREPAIIRHQAAVTKTATARAEMGQRSSNTLSWSFHFGPETDVDRVLIDSPV